jgi:hypothetical protein
MHHFFNDRFKSNTNYVMSSTECWLFGVSRLVGIGLHESHDTSSLTVSLAVLTSSDSCRRLAELVAAAVSIAVSSTVDSVLTAADDNIENEISDGLIFNTKYDNRK